jgi:hypothetical protein
VVELAGVRAGQADVARHRVFIDVDQAAGGAGTAALADMFEEGDGLGFGRRPPSSGVPLRSEKAFLQVRQ